MALALYWQFRGVGCGERIAVARCIRLATWNRWPVECEQRNRSAIGTKTIRNAAQDGDLIRVRIAAAPAAEGLPGGGPVQVIFHEGTPGPKAGMQVGLWLARKGGRAAFIGAQIEFCDVVIT